MSNSKYNVKEMWEELFGKCEEIIDYSGALIYKSACGNPNSSFEPTIDHIRPISAGGKDVKENIVICHRDTNFEKGDNFPHWKINGQRYVAKRKNGTKSGYEIYRD